MSRLIDILTAEGWDFDDATLEAILRYEDRPLSVITRKHPDGSYRASIYLSEAVLTQDGEFLIAFTNFPGNSGRSATTAPMLDDRRPGHLGGLPAMRA